MHQGRHTSGGPRQPGRDELRSRLKALDEENGEDAMLEELDDLLEAMAHPGEHLAWLAAHDLDPAISSGAAAALFYVVQSEAFPPQARERARREAAPVLLKALKSPGMPDSRKYTVGPLYSYCADEELPAEEYRAFFHDFDGISRQMLSEMVDAFSSDPHSVERVLSGMEMAVDDDMPTESRFTGAMELATHMLEVNPAAAAAVVSGNLVVGCEEGVDGAYHEPALNVLEGTNCPQAVWFLEEMGRWPNLGELGEQAARSAAKMRLSGLAPAHELPLAFSHGMVTAPDGMGSRQLALYFRTPEGGMDGLGLLLNDIVGVKDAFCVYDEGADLEEEIRDQFGDLPIALCGIELAREFFGDALARHEAQGTSPPARGFVYRPYLGPAPIAAKPRTPDLSTYRLADLERTPALVKDSAELAEAPGFDLYWFASDRAYEYVAANMPKKAPRLSKKKFEQFLHEVAIEEKEMLLSRMADTLEVESLAGRGTRRINRIAAQTWVGLSEDVAAFADTPYVRRLGELAVKATIANVRMGFRNMAEVNAAALEMDDEFGDEGPYDEPFE